MIKRIKSKVTPDAFGQPVDNNIYVEGWKPTLENIKAVYPNKEEHES